jgi:hypothetical protein
LNRRDLLLVGKRRDKLIQEDAMRIDVWLKRIWLAIGILILLVALVGLIAYVTSLLPSTKQDNGPMVGLQAQPQGPDSLIRQDISFDRPRPVGRIDLLYIGVRVRDLENAAPATSLRISRYSEVPAHQQNLVNIVFTKGDGSVTYPLLNRRAFIRTFDIPSEDDSLQFFNLYEISFDDTDNDGRISSQDSAELFISDLNGEHLSQVTARGDELQWFEKSTDGKQVFILVKQRPKTAELSPQDWPEKMFTLDTRTRILSPFPRESELFDQIRKRLWSK